MPFAAAQSQHPVAADAAGEVLGALCEQHGPGPDVVAVFASGAHAAFLGEVSATVGAVLAPRAVVGASAPAVLAGDRAVDDAPALAVWAAWGLAASTVRLPALTGDTGGVPAPAVAGVVEALAADIAPGATLAVLADPETFATEAFLDRLAVTRPDLSVAGGLASPGARPGRATLVLGDAVHHGGAIALAVPDAVAVVGQGCRPVGPAMTVTAGDGRFVHELAGRPALDRLTELAATLPAGDRALLARGAHLGVAVDERHVDLDRGHFVVHAVLGADRRRGVIAVASAVPVGATVRFHVRDPHAAAEDLRAALVGVSGTGALVFTAGGPAVTPSGVGGEASVVAGTLGTGAIAGMCCAGALGPVGGRSLVHASSASVLVFQD